MRLEAIRQECFSLMKKAQTEITFRCDLSQKRVLVLPTLYWANPIAGVLSDQ